MSITEADRAVMRLDLLGMRDDNPTEITIRRGGATLDAQTVRIARLGGQGRETSANDGSTAQSEGRVVIVGGVTLDIQVDDRFNDAHGVLYEVVFVRPNRTVVVVAEATVVQ